MTILKAENISKQYRLGLVGTGTLKHDVNRFWHRIRGKEDPYSKVGAVNDRSTQAKEEYVWALRDINFEVQQGEVLGIIGKNGAGKSTLLKILSRVTGPTTGSIKTKGRIASLLEVGTGFHPELTGRENIYLNGAILGMTKAEIAAKEDEIIDFSGCAMYIDTPVKRYSSGMRVRLGFAVAAFLEPDILVVDEVLAVGDAEFQKKAIDKMKAISTGEGRTVLFVSHNMASIQNLCTRVMLLNNGMVDIIGNTEDVINHYLHKYRNEEVSQDLASRKDRKGNGKLKFLDYWIETVDGKKVNAMQTGGHFNMIIKVNNVSDFSLNNVRISVGIDDDQARRITVLGNDLTNELIELSNRQIDLIKILIPKVPFQAGNYHFTLFASEGEDVLDWVMNAGSFEVEHGDFFNTGRTIQQNQGNILVHHEFH
ncbi:ABC transporter ATP-binding protein [Marixanthomonas spongiae]|uniref:ABC transporter ATP-binding protein n=1 Tax=Marixanthomonas spongiae TaxID=2174845 RepID=A0A2U0I5S0_9FLAO|nr:ABC transporter ATP-binding protein [Marixanthomonas spongiae]PVW16448.1 ABC transporter ATP-binding protein [Marixanthomonas spongiae]